MKKILIVGNGGREHSLCLAFKRSPQAVELYNFATAINPGIQKIAKIFLGDILDMSALKNLAQEISPDFAIVGPEDPIARGATDTLKTLGIPSFSPSKTCAQLESSKSFTRNLLQKYNVDASPDFVVSSEMSDENFRENFYQKHDGQIVVKADGLIGGKGVIVADDHFSTFDEAEKFAKKSIETFGRVVFEEKLIGEEFSLISFVDGKTALDTPVIQDYKRALNDDKGPNTGGMGTISDSNHLLPFVSQDHKNQAHEITLQTMRALEQELSEKFIGFMYGGFIITKNGVRLIEYNARLGDPEALNILSLLESDLVEICEKAFEEKLSEIGEIKFSRKSTVVRYLCPEGYPEKPVKDVEVSINIESDNENIIYASVANEADKLLLKGSRAIGLIGSGDNFDEACQSVEKIRENISGPVFWRTDIGTAEMLAKKNKV